MKLINNFEFIDDPTSSPARNKEKKVLAIIFKTFGETPEFTELILKHPEVQEAYKHISEYCNRKHYEQVVKDKFEQFKKDLSPEELIAFENMCK